MPSRHRGNVPVIQPAEQLSKPAAPPPQLQSVEKRFDTNGYPTRYSDVAALMVLGHQTHMTNLLTRLGWEARLAEYQQASPAATDTKVSAIRWSNSFCPARLMRWSRYFSVAPTPPAKAGENHVGIGSHRRHDGE